MVQGLLPVRQRVFDDGKLIESFCALGSDAEAVSLPHRLLLQTSTREPLQLFKVSKQSALRFEFALGLQDRVVGTPNLVHKILLTFKIRLLTEVRCQFLLLDGKVDSKQLGKRRGGGDGSNCNRTSGSVNLRVSRRDGAGSWECSERARSNCEVQGSGKFRWEEVGIKAWVELRLGFAKSFFLLVDLHFRLFQLAVVRSRKQNCFLQGQGFCLFFLSLHNRCGQHHQQKNYGKSSRETPMTHEAPRSSQRCRESGFPVFEATLSNGPFLSARFLREWFADC